MSAAGKVARVVAAVTVTPVLVLVSLTAAPAEAGRGRTFAPCASEDSPGPCVWDARHRGNGEGESFIRRRAGRVVYVSHRRAHRVAEEPAADCPS